MPFSYAQYAGDGSTTTFSVPFPYLLKAHVKLYTGYVPATGSYATQLAEGSDFTWVSDTQVQTTVAPAIAVTLTIKRETPSNARLVDWTDGSNLIATDLDTADLQNLFVVQEQQDRVDAAVALAIQAQSDAAAALASVGLPQILQARQVNTSGSLPASTWTQRILNDVTTATIPGATVAGGDIYLPAGTYEADAYAIAFVAGANQVRLNIGSGASIAYGSNEFAGYTSTGSLYTLRSTTKSHVRARFVIASTSVVRLEHWADVSTSIGTSYGQGLPTAATGTTDVFADVLIRKLA